VAWEWLVQHGSVCASVSLLLLVEGRGSRWRWESRMALESPPGRSLEAAPEPWVLLRPLPWDSPLAAAWR
jgi:hypothetical protein